MSVLFDLKHLFNPSGFNPKLAPVVIAKDGYIPLVLSKLIAPEVEITGNVVIEQDVTIRRMSRVLGTAARGSVLRRNALMMDGCYLEDSTLEEGAGFAHGGTSRFAHWGARSFANIDPRLEGTLEQPIIVEPGAYIGPGVRVPKGVTIREGLYYIGSPARILPRTHLNQDTFEPLEGWDAFLNGRDEEGATVHRPITLSQADFDWIDAQQAKIDALTPQTKLGAFMLAAWQFVTRSAGRNAEQKAQLKRELDTFLKRYWRLDRRPYKLPPFLDVDIRQLADIGVDAWIAQQQREVIHRPSLYNWLYYYINPTQHIKQIDYQHEAARQHGDIIWHHAPMQSQILHLDRAWRILLAAQQRDLAGDVEYLIRAKKYLLGLDPFTHKPVRDIEAALLNSDAIIQRVQYALGSLKGAQQIHVHREGRAGHALLPISSDNQLTVEVDDAMRAELAEKLGQLANLYGFAPQAFARVPQARSSLVDHTIVISPPGWLNALNPHRINFATLVDGPRVSSFGSQVPVIEDNAILVGNVDVLGAVHVGAGVILKDTTLRSEQTSAPVTVLGYTIIDGTFVHTATKEQYPALIDGRTGPIVLEGGHAHGVEIDAHTYSDHALLSDEGRIRGVVAKGAMNIGQKFAGQDGALVFEGGSPSTDVLRTNKGGLKNMELFEAYRAWWKQSDFKDIPFDEHGADETLVKQRIEAIYGQRQVAVNRLLADKCAEYGPLYEVSAQWQAMALQARHAAQIFQNIGNARHAQEMFLYAEGLDHMLGKRETISAQALQRLEQKGGLGHVVFALKVLAQSGRTVEIPNWEDNGSPYAYTKAQALAVAHGSAREVNDLARRNFALADDPRVTGDSAGDKEEGFTHVITAQTAIDRGMPDVLKFESKTLLAMADILSTLPQRLAALRDHAKAQPATGPRHGLAGQRLNA